MYELSKREEESIKIIMAYDGLVKMYGRNNMIFDASNLVRNGLVTQITVHHSGASEIKAKNIWWNRKKKTVEFVKELRSKACARTARNGNYYWKTTYNALTPLGFKYIADKDV